MIVGLIVAAALGLAIAMVWTTSLENRYWREVWGRKA